MRAGITYFFSISLLDIYANLHTETVSETEAAFEIIGSYVDHNEWLSPIGIADYSEW